MKKLFWQMVVSLDGFMEAPDGSFDWHVGGEQFDRYVRDMLGSIDAILLGRVTYEGFASYWPSSSDAEATKMNTLPKVVFSKSLQGADWNNSRIVRDAGVDEIARLKRDGGKDLALLASADLASTLLPLGLIDEVRVLVMPVVLGGGRPMFKGPERMALELLETQVFETGVVCMNYRPVTQTRA